jgi:hypothetical protein
VTQRWITPDYRYFEVEGEDKRVYLLRQNIPSSEWQVLEL